MFNLLLVFRALSVFFAAQQVVAEWDRCVPWNGGWTGQRDHTGFSRVPMNIRFKNYETKLTVSQPVTGKCTKDTKLLIIVLSRPETFKLRKQIRETWAANLKSDTRLLFLMGRPSDQRNAGTECWWENPSTLGKNKNKIVNGIKKENLKHGDLLVTDNVDQYGKNVTIKLIAAFRWMKRFCKSAKFMMKIDDDSVMDVQRLHYWIDKEFEKKTAEAPQRRAIFGSVFTQKWSPIRDPRHKWHELQTDYPWNRYPEYMNGPSYLLSIEAIRAIVHRTRKFNILRLEDLMITGVLSEAGGVWRVEAEIHFRTFGNFQQYEKCSEDRVPYIISLTTNASPNVQENMNRLHSVGCA